MSWNYRKGPPISTAALSAPRDLYQLRRAVHRKPKGLPRNRRQSKFSEDAAAWAASALGFIADEKQTLVLRSTATRGILNCSRQWGKSTTCAIKAVHYAHFHPGSLVLVASPSLRQSAEFILKARHVVSKLGIRPRGDGENRCSLKFPNGSRIIGLPDRESTVRGFSSVGLLIVDEAARVSEELYATLRPMLAVSGGSLWLMSTPNGRSGFFYREWTGAAPWLRITATAEECPRISPEFLRQERLSTNDEFYRQDYCCEFVSGEGALFDEDLIRAKLSPLLQPLWK